MDNSAGEMEVFVQAARLQSFSAAGRLLKMSPSAVSKLVARLEQRLGARLVVRTTRNLQLTDEGQLYFERAQRILEEIREAEHLVSTGGTSIPRGRLRVSASVAFGVQFIVPLIPDFLALYPDVQIDLSLTDDIINIVGERTDIAIRSGKLRDTSLMARKIADSRRILVASPAYIEKNGRPRTPSDLDSHNCMTFNFRTTLEEWPFRDPVSGEVYARAVKGNAQVNNGPTMRSLCLAGVGITRIGQFNVQRDIDAGKLVAILEDFNTEEREQIHAVYAGHANLATRIRAFIDFVAERI